MHFLELKTAVAEQWQRMSGHELFRTGADKDAMWITYLDSFPEGTNPIFRERTVHDCSCCRQFIRAVGDVVAIIDGELTSIWDISIPTAAYQIVANAMTELVKSVPIGNVFLHTEATAGTDKNFEQMPDRVQTWDHFFVRLPNSRVCRGVAELLWELPLTSRTKANLNDIAIGLHNQLKHDTVSFVDDAEVPNPKVQLAFDIVKHIIDTKKAEAKAQADKTAKAEQKQKILGILARKQDEKLEGASEDELRQMIANL